MNYKNTDINKYEREITYSDTISISINIFNYVGYYEIGKESGLQIALTKKPKWLHRKMMFIFFGIEWFDN